MTSTAHIPELPQAESPRAEFALWSKVYDESPNPMLALEERFLSLLLPLDFRIGHRRHRLRNRAMARAIHRKRILQTDRH